MGVRLYNPTTGRFLTTDPVYGGNATSYGYPVDPINRSDIDGLTQRGDYGGIGTGTGAVGRTIGDVSRLLLRALTGYGYETTRSAFAGYVNVLHFSNGWRYVGSTVNLTSRLLSHWRRNAKGLFGGPNLKITYIEAYYFNNLSNRRALDIQEQRYINREGGLGDGLFNSVNAVAPRLWRAYNIRAPYTGGGGDF